MTELTNDQIKRANALRERRRTPSHIARHLKVPGDVVRQHFGLPPQRWAGLSPVIFDEIRSAWQSGVSRESICRQYQIGHRRADEICAGVIRDKIEPKPRKPRNKGPEVVSVPTWVPAHLSDVYLNIAERDGEEHAASICRKLKNGSSIKASAQVSISLLPAVVSPAGCA